ncbi:50S ribosomal protein L28 [Demequina maris]|uniref:50S ribosomal protein L28 n=1 Tax=Demequina maris TaxID=1638982 RepID=UPI00078331F6|nr:50S ribosomal protein L28 [Demequina maris]
MSRQRCQVTGAVPSFGNTISHSHKRSGRRWDVNIQRKRFWAPSLGRNVTLNVSTKGLKVIDRDGIDAVVGRILARGERV